MAAFAQYEIEQIEENVFQEQNSNYQLKVEPISKQNRVTNKTEQGGWLSVPELMQSRGGFWQGAIFNRLFPDSFVNIVSNDGELFQPAFHALGNSFDPRDPLYVVQTTNTGNWQVGLHDSYNLDSIAVQYAYVRETRTMMVDTVEVDVIDTLFVHYIPRNGMNRFRFNDENIGGFGVPTGLNVNNLRPLVVAYTDTILLNDELATQFEREGTSLSTSVITVTIPENLRRVDHLFDDFGSAPVGVSFVYKPGMSYNPWDTIISFDDNVVLDKQFNDFGLVSFGNEGSNWSHRVNFNNTFVANRQVRYGQLFGSIRGHLPIIANLGWQRDVYLNCSFHVSENPDRRWGNVTNLTQPLASRVYPNPVAGGNAVTIQLLEEASLNDVNIALYDILGNTMNVSANISGDLSFTMSTDNLAKGVYFIQVSYNNQSSTHRVIVQ